MLIFFAYLRSRVAHGCLRARNVLIFATCLFGLATTAHAATATASWNANPEPDIAGYKLSFGTASGSYTSTIDVGMVTSYAVQVVEGTTYYFVVQAYNKSGLVSPYSAEVPYTVPAAALTPAITNLSPSAGAIGTVVTITGTNFGTAKGTSVVTFNSTTATPTSWSATSIVVAVPTGATTGNVVVTVGGLPSNALPYTVSVAPTLTNLSPTSGPAGTSVTITGTNFGATRGASTVTFNGTSAAPISWSATSIVAPVPAGATTGGVAVTVGGIASNSVPFTVTANSPAKTTTAFVQQAYATPQPSATAVNVPFASAQTAGNLNVVVVGWNDARRTVQSVTDTNGNVYVRAVGPTILRKAATQSIYYAKNITAAAAGANTVTVWFNRSAASPDIRVAEYSGLDTTSPFDAASGASGTSAVGNSGAVTTTSATDLLVGANLTLGTTSGPGAGFTSRVITVDGDIVEDQFVTSTGTYSATAPLTQSTGWIMQLVAFHAAAGTGSVATPTLTSLSPTSGPIGTSVAIAGTNFGASGGTSVAPKNDGVRGSDYDGDGQSDLAMFIPTTSNWAILLSGANYSSSLTVPLGANGDVPVPGDYDGDGQTDVAVYRPSEGKWLVRTSTSGYTVSVAYLWGAAGDVPVPGDYDGDGITDLAVYRPTTGEWFITLSATKTTATFVLGASGDVPVVGDFDGDHKTDLGVFTPSTGAWTVRTSSTNYTTGPIVSLGVSTDVPVPGDYDGDGLTDMATYSPSTGRWSLLGSRTGYSSITTVTLGGNGAIPAAGDYDGDGQTDVAVYRPSTGLWTIVKSGDGSTMTVAWGTSASVPVPYHP